MRRSPGLALARLVTVVAEEPAVVNVYQTVRCRPPYSRSMRHDLMEEWVGMSQRAFWQWLLRNKEWALSTAGPSGNTCSFIGRAGCLEDSPHSPSPQRYCVASLLPASRVVHRGRRSGHRLHFEPSVAARPGTCIPRAVTRRTGTQEITGSGDPS